MKDVILKTKRVEMKFSLSFIAPQIIVEAIDDRDIIGLILRQFNMDDEKAMFKKGNR